MDFNQAEKILNMSLMPEHKPDMSYRCISCGAENSLDELLYTCPACGALLRVVDRNFDSLAEIPGEKWRAIFDLRRSLGVEAMSGIFLFHELILPQLDLEDIVYLGEGHTPMIRANRELAELVGVEFYIKNDGQNPSASFKDRGMASAISFLRSYIRRHRPENILAICASTGDTSAAAALYLSYLPKDVVKSAVLLPKGKVTAQQLGQPLGSGAKVIEIPGVFDDCMKIVEELADKYNVFLLNSKNPVRICGQKSFAFETAQQLGWKTADATVVVPIGNAGNVTAIMEGFNDLLRLEIIDGLPTLLGIQSERANPVALWRDSGNFEPVKVTPSVAQAAMIGNPVSFPKVEGLVGEVFKDRFKCISVSEQEIMDSMLTANRHGHVVCTQGGEAVAGLMKALKSGVVSPEGKFVCDSTSHQLKFADFQNSYFEGGMEEQFSIVSKSELVNSPVALGASAEEIASHLELKRKA